MKTRLHSRRFFIQVLSLTIGLLLALCIVFSAILYSNIRKANDASILLAEADRSKELLRQSTNCWKQYIAAAGSFARLDISYDNLSVTEDFSASSLLRSMIRSHVSANSYTNNIDVFISGKPIYPSDLSHDRHIGHFYFFDIYTENEPEWPYSFDLVTTYTNSFNKVEITVDAFYLSRFLFSFNEPERMDFLLLPDDRILLCNHYEDLFRSIYEVLPELDVQPLEPDAQALPSWGEYDYFLSDADSYGFRLLSLIPKTLHSGQYTASSQRAVLMSAALLLVGLTISVFLTFFFYRPVKKTLDLLLTYVPQELHDYENEIQFIHQSIKKYIGNSNSGAALAGTYARLQSAQTAVLQHQINSHFLFNTLENIKALSVTELGADNEIENSIILLNNIIHEGMFQKNLLVRLSVELHLAQSYLDMMLIRYPDVQVQWTVDDTLLQCQVFKFTIQPILENCFSHAFKGNLGRQKSIGITVSRSDGDLSILIGDNGLGISANEAMQLSKALYLSDETDNVQHLGMRNIHQRITDTFGQKYGIRISDSCPGLTVEIRYPVLPESLP